MVGRKKYEDTTTGKIGTPSILPGMNKLPPARRGGGKGASDDKDNVILGDKDKADDEKIMSRIRKRFARCIEAESENRKAELDDKKFLTGEGQWPADVAAQRNFDRRPCLTINKLPTFLNQITNDQRQNRPAINVSPVGDRGDPQAAKMYRGLIRAIERDSAADIAYDTAFADAAGIGEGYWLITASYESEETFRQVLRIVRIRNRFTVYLDPDCQDPTGADAKYGFVTNMIPRDEYEQQWPDADPMSFNQGGLGEKTTNWMTSDAVRIAEYYEIKNEMRTLVFLSNGFEGWKDGLSDEVKDDIKDGKITVEKERESPCPKVTWYKVNAVEILERTPWLGRWVPIVKVTGNEVDIEGKLKLSGMIRNAKQAQLMYNYGRTTELEVMGLQPKAPFVGAEGQFEGHETEWKQANTSASPYLTYKPESLDGQLLPPPQRQAFPGAPSGVIQFTQTAAQDMMATTGIRFDATMQERTIDESGRALREIRRTGDLTSFHYVDNLCRSLKRCGEILIDAIPHYYDTKQVVTILRDDDTEDTVQIDPNAPKAVGEQRYAANHPTKPGKVQKIFNPTIGKYGVTVTTGPSYATKRIEASESMADFARAMPQTAEVFVDIIAKNQDWPGAEEIASRLAKLVASKFPQVMTPDMKEVPPQVQAMLQSMDAQIKQLMQERVQMMKALNDQNADRQIEMEGINKKFEAALAKIIADFDTKTAATKQKEVANVTTHAHAIADLGIRVTELMHKISQPVEPAQNGAES